MRLILTTRAAWAAVLFAAIALPAPAQTDRIAARGGVAYLSGGIGEGAQARLKSREPEFNLKLVFSLIQGNYVADVGVVVKDAAGKALIEQVSEGPIFMARLPAGAYSVQANYEGRTQSRRVRVDDRLRTEHFRWPGDPDADLPVSRWLEPGSGATGIAGSKPKTGAKPPAVTPPGAAVAVVSGGIGAGELAELKAKEGDYNLKLVFTLNEGNYLADVDVVIRDAAGRTVVERRAEGPVLLAKLLPGSYSANVAYGGKAQTRKVRVGERLHTEYFRWPGDPEADFPLPRDQAEGAKPKTGAKRG